MWPLSGCGCYYGEVVVDVVVWGGCRDCGCGLYGLVWLQSGRIYRYGCVVMTLSWLWLKWYFVVVELLSWL